MRSAAQIKAAKGPGIFARHPPPQTWIYKSYTSNINRYISIRNQRIDLFVIPTKQKSSDCFSDIKKKIFSFSLSNSHTKSNFHLPITFDEKYCSITCKNKCRVSFMRRVVFKDGILFYSRSLTNLVMQLRIWQPEMTLVDARVATAKQYAVNTGFNFRTVGHK